MKGLSAVADERFRTDKLDGVIKHRWSRETTMVGGGAFRHIPGCYEAELTPQTLISRRCPLRRAFDERRVERFDELLTFCFQGHDSRNLNDSVLIFSCLARDGLGALR